MAAKTLIRGPATSREQYSALDMVISRNGAKAVKLTVRGSEPIEAKLGEWSVWVPLKFKIEFRELCGQIKFMLLELEPHLRLYGSAIHLDPSAQAYPFTCPDCFGAELVNKIGAFHTLGMSEQSGPLLDKRYDFPVFLSECQAITGERRKILDLELNRFDGGLLACVLDTSDRLQHAFWASRDPLHPAHASQKAYVQVIPGMYREMDDILGEVLAKIDSRTALLVLSDHGFNSFRRAAHLNRWLIENGYMHLKETNAKDGQQLFLDVDWSRTQAYALGFCGIYLNLKGREGQGVVEPEGQRKLLEELAAKLREWKDTVSGAPIIHQVYFGTELYHGPATPEGPDLVLGLKPGFRVSWQTATGGAPLPLVVDNVDLGSGDHLIDPTFVPGVPSATRPLRSRRRACWISPPLFCAAWDSTPPRT